MLINLYATPDGLYWHRDDDPNDGDGEYPIISYSLGNDAKFGYVDLMGEKQVVLLKSGDVVCLEELFEIRVLNTSSS